MLPIVVFLLAIGSLILCMDVKAVDPFDPRSAVIAAALNGASLFLFLGSAILFVLRARRERKGASNGARWKPNRWHIGALVAFTIVVCQLGFGLAKARASARRVVLGAAVQYYTKKEALFEEAGALDPHTLVSQEAIRTRLAMLREWRMATEHLMGLLEEDPEHEPEHALLAARLECFVACESYLEFLDKYWGRWAVDAATSTLQIDEPVLERMYDALWEQVVRNGQEVVELVKKRADS